VAFANTSRRETIDAIEIIPPDEALRNTRAIRLTTMLDDYG
jgi:hypothetical protein